MKTSAKIIFTILLFFISCLGASESDADPAGILKHIAKDIHALKSEFPQLKSFVSPKTFKEDTYEISYQFDSLGPQGGDGWSGGTPHPKDDGVWFYISIHLPSSARQIHAQPITVPAYLGSYKFQFLLKEGRKTKSLNAAMWAIFKKHGVILKNKNNGAIKQPNTDSGANAPPPVS